MHDDEDDNNNDKICHSSNCVDCVDPIVAVVLHRVAIVTTKSALVLASTLFQH